MTVVPAVGFDLDMTLIDSRPGIAATYRELSRRTGVYVDADAAVSRLGPPLRDELRRWFPPEQVEGAVAAYRELYPAYAITPSRPLPWAAEALAGTRALGLRVVVVTSKIGRLARLHLDHLEMADMAAARAAGIPGIGVTTGPCTVEQLRAAGADAVLDGLARLPGVLRGIAVGSVPTGG